VVEIIINQAYFSSISGKFIFYKKPLCVGILSFNVVDAIHLNNPRMPVIMRQKSGN